VAEFGFVMLRQLEKFYIFSENVQAFLLRLDNAKNNGADAPSRDQNGKTQKKEKQGAHTLFIFYFHLTPP
jgi:hypothetical protein